MSKEINRYNPDVVIATDYTEVVVGQKQNIEQLFIKRDSGAAIELYSRTGYADEDPITWLEAHCTPETDRQEFALYASVSLNTTTDVELWRERFMADYANYIHHGSALAMQPGDITCSPNSLRTYYFYLSPHRCAVAEWTHSSQSTDQELITLRTIDSSHAPFSPDQTLPEATPDPDNDRRMSDTVAFFHLWAELQDSILQEYGVVDYEKDCRKIILRPVADTSSLHSHEEEKRLSFDDIAGYHRTKEQLLDLALVHKYPELAAQMELSKTHGILLHGEPGTGKTTLINALVNELDATLTTVSVSQVVEKFVGESARNLDSMFKKIKKNARTNEHRLFLVFMDEFDSLGAARKGESGERNDVINRLKEHISDITANYSNIILTAATNNKDAIDPSLLRSGRFDCVAVPRPNEQERREIFGLLIGKIATNDYLSQIDGSDNKQSSDLPHLSLDKDDAIDINQLSLLSEGLTGADIEAIMNIVKRKRLREWDKAVRQARATNSVMPKHLRPISHNELLQLVNEFIQQREA